jgi:hypothetical protein
MEYAASVYSPHKSEVLSTGHQVRIEKKARKHCQNYVNEIENIKDV